MEKETQFDLLDMNNYRIEKLPKLQKTGFERWMAVFGGSLAAIAFVYIYWFANIPFLDTFDITALGKESAKRFDELGAEGFSRINYAMLAFPVALLIEHIYILPFNSKPAALLYTTDQYSWSDTFKFGFSMMVISWIMIIVWGETVLRWLGYTNGLFF